MLGKIFGASFFLWVWVGNKAKHCSARGGNVHVVFYLFVWSERAEGLCPIYCGMNGSVSLSCCQQASSRSVLFTELWSFFSQVFTFLCFYILLEALLGFLTSLEDYRAVFVISTTSSFTYVSLAIKGF